LIKTNDDTSKKEKFLTMKFSFPFLLLITFGAQAQDSFYSSPFVRIDTTSSNINPKIDSVQFHLNNILAPDFDKLTSKNRFHKLKPQDSLRAIYELDSLKSGLTLKIDSLRSHGLPTDKYTRKLDSLSNIGPQKYIELTQARARKLEEQIKSPVTNTIQKVNQPVEQLQDKVNRPIDNVESKINDKLNVMRQEGGTDANLPGNLNTGNVSLDNAGLPNTDLNTGVDLNNKIDLPGTENSFPKLDNPVDGQMGKLNDIGDKTTELKSVPQQQLEKIKSIDEIQTVRDKVGDINTATDKVQAYEGDIKNIAQGNIGEVKAIPDAIENKAAGLDELKDLQAQTAEIDKLKDLSSKANDPKAMKEMAKQELKKQAMNHFEGKEAVLKSAMGEMAKLKSKYDKVTSLKDLPKRPPNPMKRKPLLERIVPGVTLQFQKTTHFTVDINPFISYRFTGRLNAGLGWNERLVFLKWNKLSTPDRVFGPRTFGTFGFRKGFSVKAEIEKMNTLVPASAISRDGGYQWVWSAFVGFKKDYTFIKKITGNVQVLYNIYDDHDNSPYADRLNVRMGFEFPMKKRNKK
jgi:hypothetical protein